MPISPPSQHRALIGIFEPIRLVFLYLLLTPIVACGGGAADGTEASGGASTTASPGAIRCSGTPKQHCADIEEGACSDTPGCGTVPGCTSTGILPHCYLRHDYDCADQPGCYIDLHGGTCTGTPIGSCNNVLIHGCAARSDCTWAVLCKASADSCEELNEYDCEHRPGCVLETE